MSEAGGGRSLLAEPSVPAGAAGSRSFDGPAMRRWISRGAEVLSDARGRLDALNVFPVADSDTGTNLYLTLAEGHAALAEVPPDAPLAEVAQAVAYGALLGARGNSGIILSQYLRALGESFADQAEAEGGQWAAALDHAALSARAAMAEPVEGTALTVVGAAADAGRRAAYLARGLADIPVAEVVLAASSAAREALARTPSMLAPLAERGVVDSGGAGFVLLLQALVEVVTGAAQDAPLTLTAPPRNAGDEGADLPVRSSSDCLELDHDHGHRHGHDLEHYQAGAYEVMYVVTAAEDDADRLREALGRIGVSVGVVGGVSAGNSTGLWHVHVHTDEPLSAVTAAEGAPIRQVCVRFLHRERADDQTLGVVACTRAPGLIAPLAGTGAVVVYVDPGDPEIGGGISRAIVDSGTARVAVLPCGPRTAAAAQDVVATLSSRGVPLEVEVLPSRGEAAVVAGVAGLAGATSVQEALELVRAGVVRTRTASVHWPPPEDGALADVAADTVTQLLRPGDVILTVVAGRGVRRDALDAVGAAARARVGEIEVLELDGGQVSPALALGVE